MKDFANSATNPYTAKFSSVMNQTVYFRACDKVGNCSDYVSAKVCIKKKTASIGGNNGKWIAIDNPRSCSPAGGYIPANGNGVCGNVVGKINLTYSNNKVTVNWEIRQGNQTWIGIGYYVDIIIQKNGKNYTSDRIKQTTESWNPGGPPNKGSKVFSLPAGTYSIGFSSNTFEPSYNYNMATITIN